MRIVMLTLGAAICVAGSPAFAQDLSGFRVEGRLGWDQAGAKARLPNPDDEDDVDGDEFLTASEKSDGVGYGFELGYDGYLSDSLVLGAYAGADFADRSSCSEVLGDDLACGKAGRIFNFGVRAGVPLGQSSLLYVKGGYSNGKLKASYDFDVTDNDEEDPGEIARHSETRDGYHAGAGIEAGLTPNIYAKFEYLYTDLGKKSYFLDEDQETALGLSSDRHQVMAGVGLRF